MKLVLSSRKEQEEEEKKKKNSFQLTMGHGTSQAERDYRQAVVQQDLAQRELLERYEYEKSLDEAIERVRQEASAARRANYDFVDQSVKSTAQGLIGRPSAGGFNFSGASRLQNEQRKKADAYAASRPQRTVQTTPTTEISEWSSVSDLMKWNEEQQKNRVSEEQKKKEEADYSKWRDERDALIDRYVNAYERAEDQMKHEDRAATSDGYLDAMREWQEASKAVDAVGGIENLRKLQIEDAEKDRVYKAKLAGMDLDRMTFWDKAATALGGMLTGALKQYGASTLGEYQNAQAGNIRNTVESEIDDALRFAAKQYLSVAGSSGRGGSHEYVQSLRDNIRKTAESLGGADYADRVMDYIDGQAQQADPLAGFDLSAIPRDEDETYKKLFALTQSGTGESIFDIEKAFELQDSANADLQRAKNAMGELGGLGDFVIDAGSSAIQSGLDAVKTSALGLNNMGAVSMLPFASRAAGGAYLEGARAVMSRGEEIGKEMAKNLNRYAGQSGAIEAATELLWGSVGAMSKVTGGGALDEVTTKKLTGALQRMAKTETGAKILGSLGEKVIGGAFEGTEEVLSDALNWMLDTAGIIGEDRGTLGDMLKDAGKSFVTGALSGLFGEVTGAVSGRMRDAQIGSNIRSELKAGDTSYLDSIAAAASQYKGDLQDTFDKIVDKRDIFLDDGSISFADQADKMSNVDLGKLAQAYEEQIAGDDYDDIERALKRLENGKELTERDVTRIVRNEAVTDYLAERSGVEIAEESKTADAIEALKALASRREASKSAREENVQEEVENAVESDSEARTGLNRDLRYNRSEEEVVRAMAERAQPLSAAESIRAQTGEEARAGKFGVQAVQKLLPVENALERLGINEIAREDIVNAYNPNQDAVEYAGEQTRFYNQGMEGRSFDYAAAGENPTVSLAQARIAYTAGRAELSVNQKEANNGKESGEDLRVYESGERNDGAYPVGSAEGLVENAGRDQIGQAGQQQTAKGIAGIRQKSKVGVALSSVGASAESIKASMSRPGSGYQMVTDINDKDYAAAKKVADDVDADLVAWRGKAALMDGGVRNGFVKIVTDKDGNVVGRPTIFVQLDSESGDTGEMIAMHEAGHIRIARGEIVLGDLHESADDSGRATVRDYLIKEKGEDAFWDALISYADAHARSRDNDGNPVMDENGNYKEKYLKEIFEEMICDAGANMNANIQIGHYAAAHKHSPVMEAAKAYTDQVAVNKTRGSPEEINRGYTARSQQDVYDSPVKTSIVIADAIAQRAMEVAGQKGADVKAVKAAHDNIRTLIDIVRPLMGKTDKNGMPLIPDETQYSNNIFANGSYGFDAEPTTECYRQMGYRALAKMVTDKLGRPLTNLEAIIVNQAAVEIAIDPPCLYCYSLLDRKAKEAYKIQYLNERDRFEQMFEQDYGKDRAALLKDIDKQMDTSDPASYYSIYLNNGKGTRTDNKDKRARVRLWMEMWAKGIKGPTLYDVRNMEAEEETAKKYAGIKDSTQRKYMQESLKDVQKWVQAASQAKKYIPYTAYTNDGKGNLLNWKKNRVDLLNSEYGLRWYSHADYHPAFTIDNMQQVIDASILGLKGLMYCKPIAAAKIMAPTGMNINVSCFAQFKNGKYVSDDKLGANWDEVKALRKDYKNVGSVMVVTSDDMLLWALTQDWIDTVIPLHRVRSGSEFIQEFGLSDYTGQQSDKLNGQAAKDKYDEYLAAYAKQMEEETGKKLTPAQMKSARNKMKAVYPAEHQNRYDKYIDICEERGITPRFDKIRQEILTGEYSYDGVQLTPEMYMKLVNETRQSESETQVLQPTFDMKAATEAVESLESQGYFEYFKDASEWNGKRMTLEDWADQAVKDIKAGKKPNDLGYGRDLAVNEKGQYIVSRKQAQAEGLHGIHQGVKNSTVLDKDSNGKKLSEGQAEYFKSSKVRDDEGRLLAVYHGTQSKGFTVFQEMPLRNGKVFGEGFYFAPSEKDAKTWGPNVIEAYLNITNPYYGSSSDQAPPEIIAMAKDHYGKVYDKLSANPKWYGNKYTRSEYIDSMERMYSNASVALSSAVDTGDLSDDMSESAYNTEVARRKTEILKSLGYDGVIVKQGKHTEYVAFSAEQIKRTDNLNPTENPDIRYSSILSRSKRMATDEQFRFLNDYDTFIHYSKKYRDRYGTMEEIGDYEELEKLRSAIKSRITIISKKARFGVAETDKWHYIFEIVSDTLILNDRVDHDEMNRILKEVEAIYGKRKSGNAILADAIERIQSRPRRSTYHFVDGEETGRSAISDAVDGQEPNSDGRRHTQSSENDNGRDDIVKASTVLGGSDFVAGGDSVTKFSRDLSGTELYEANRQLRKDLSELRAKLKTRTTQKEYWKGQTKVTEGRRARLDDAKKLARTLAKEHGSKIDVDVVGAKLKDLADFCLNEREFDDAFYEEARMRTYEIAHMILDDSEILRDEGDPASYEKLRDYLRKTKLYVPGNMQHDLAEDYQAFRKSLLGTVTLTTSDTSATGIDVAYTELQGIFGKGLFPDINHPADQFKRIMEILESFKPIYERMNSYEMAEAVEWTANDILGRVVGEENRQTDPTYADKMEARLKAEREKGREALKQVRAKRDQQVQALKDHYRQMAEDKRAKRIDSENRTKLLNIARRLNNKKLDRVTRALLDKYIGDLDLVSKSLTGKSIHDLQGLQTWYEAYKKKMGADFIPIQSIEDRLERLSKKHISDMTQEEVADLTTILKHLENEIRTANKLINSQETRDTYAAGMEVIDDIRGTRGVKHDVLNKFIVTETLSPVREIRRLTGYREHDPLYTATKELADGQRKMLDYQRRAESLFDTWTQDKAFIRRIAGKNATEITVQGLVNGELTDVKITPAMRMALYLHAKNDGNMKHISKGGVKIPDMALYKKGKTQEAYNKGTRVVFSRSMLNKIASKMEADERAFADAVSWYYNNMSRNEINETSELLKGFSIAGVDYYYPIDTDGNFLKKDFDAIKRDGSIEGMGFLKERIDNPTNPIMLYDMNDTLNKSINQHSKYVGLAIPVRNFNKLYRATKFSEREVNYEADPFDRQDWQYDTTVVEALKDKWGDEADAYVENMLTDIQNGTALDRDAWGDLGSKIRSKYAGAVLTTNASVAFKQAASYPTAAAVIGFAPLRKALLNSNRRVDLKKVEKLTALLWYRMKGFSNVELGDIGKEGHQIPKALNWIQGIDVWTTRKLWLAAEYYVEANNKDLKRGTEAFDLATAEIYNRIIEETQPNYTMMQRPQILRSRNAWTRAVNMFKTQPFQNFNILYDAFGNVRAQARYYKANATEENLNALKEARKGAARAVASQFVSAFVFALMQFGWDALRGKTKKYKDDEDEMNLLSWLKGMGLNMLSSVGGMIPLGGYALEAGEALADKVIQGFGGDAFFNQTFYGMADNASESYNDMVNAMLKLASNASEILSGNKISESRIRTLVDSGADIAQFVGLPVSNWIKTLQAVARQTIMQPAYLGGGNKYLAEYKAMRITTDPTKYKSDYYKLLLKTLDKDDMDSYVLLYDTMLEDKDLLTGKNPFDTESSTATKNINGKIKEWGMAVLEDAWYNNPESFEELRQKMINLHGDPFATSTQTAEQSIDEKVRKWEKDRAKSSNENDTLYSRVYDGITTSSLWATATKDQQDKALEKLLSMAVAEGDPGYDKNGASRLEKARGGASVGLDETEYTLFLLAMSMADPDGGSIKNSELEAAIRMVPDLNDAERSYLWSTQRESDKNNPWK